MLCCAAAAHAEKRIALVIGNDRYANLSANEQLQKAVNDARAVGGALRQIGFDVISGENLGRQALLARLDEAAQRLTTGDTAFFFFSGHGVAVNGANYVLPADVPAIGSGQIASLTGAAIKEEDITDRFLSAGARVTVLVLDACRTNPFAPGGGKGIGIAKGLVPPPQVKGVFSLYAAGSGQEALDRLYDGDPSQNSVFSRVLVPALTRPGVDLTALAFDVREEVARIAGTAGHDQRPAYYDETIGGRIYLAGTPPAGGQPVPPAAPDAAQAWGAVQNTTSIAVLDEFLRQFGNSQFYGALARARREELAKAPLVKEPAKPAGGPQIAAVAPPVKPAIPVDAPCSGPVTVSFASWCAAPLTAVQERGLKAKDTFRECENCPEMVVLPAGVFTMGSPDGEQGRSGKEGPHHAVTIRKPFAAGRLHVTVDQFAAFVREAGYAASSPCDGGQGRSWRNPGFTQEGSHPVVCVTWDDARAYVDWLAKKTGKPYRLLSEAEWEYAARGARLLAVPRFWFGDDEKDLCRYGNFKDQKAGNSSACNDGYANTSPAGHYEPNAFGLYDMFGNAWQWTADCWHINYNGAPADGSAWTTECQGGFHTVRGGSWNNDPKDLRVVARGGNIVGHINTGFRLARTLAP
jgi:formylglycine-generating enzyme required for sulfatase activity